jgi:hypothetical protein
MPKVSVVIPTYNRADMVGAAIQSVLDQTYDDWEVIVIDDGSIDNTAEIVHRSADPRIHYYYQVNKGLPGARNVGIRRATGEYIAFLDSDDLCYSTRLASQVALLDSDPTLGLVAGGHIEVDLTLKPLREVRPWLTQPLLRLEDVVLGCAVCPSAVMTRREWLARVGGFDENMRHQEDWDLWLRLAAQGCPMVWHKGPACYYRLHPGTMARDAAMMHAGALTALDKLYTIPDLSEAILAFKARAYATVELDGAARACASATPEAGCLWLATALQLCPDLGQGHPPPFLSALATFGLTLTADLRARYVAAILTIWPSSVTPRWTARRIRALMHVAAAMEHDQRHEFRQMAAACGQALWFDWRWLRSRWWWAMIVRSLRRRTVLVGY